MNLSKGGLEKLTGHPLKYEELEGHPAMLLAYSDHARSLTEEQREPFQIFDVMDTPVLVEGKEVAFCRGECHGPSRLSGVYHRGANIVFVRDGRVYVPKRSETKDLYPGCADFSVAEHLLPRESYGSAAVRGCKEELGVDIKEEDLDLFLRCHIDDRQQNEQVAYFRLDYAGKDFDLSDEILRGGWHPIDMLRKTSYLRRLNFRRDHYPAFKKFLEI